MAKKLRYTIVRDGTGWAVIDRLKPRLHDDVVDRCVSRDAARRVARILNQGSASAQSAAEARPA
jgi:hypothetical protein